MTTVALTAPARSTLGIDARTPPKCGVRAASAVRSRGGGVAAESGARAAGAQSTVILQQCCYPPLLRHQLGCPTIKAQHGVWMVAVAE